MDTLVDCVPVTFSINEIDVLNKAFRDKNFRKQFEDFAKQICDPKNINHFESELKKFEKERGVDVKLLNPSPGISLLAKTLDKSENVCINISVSDKIEKPNFTYTEESVDNIKWSVPHAILKPRLEVNLEEALVDGNIVSPIDDHIKQEYISAAKRDGVWVYEIVVNQVCIDLAKITESLKDHLITIAKESLKNKLKVELKDEKFLGFDIYIGKSTISQLKSVENSELYNRDSVMNLCSKENKDKTCLNSFAKDTFNEKFKNADKPIKLIKPQYKLKHVDHVTLQDYSIIRNEYPSSLKSQSLLLEIDLPGITSASDIDVDIIGNKEFHLKSKNGVEYNLDLKLPYEVEEEPIRAKFNISTSSLEIELKVINYSAQISCDSGIECDNTYRTSSDNDNSSVSSNEENNLKSIVSSDDKVLTFQFNQGDQFVYISMDSDSINTESIKLNIIDSQSFLCSFENVNKECNIIYILVDNSIKEKGITSFLLGQTVWIQIEKSKPKMWSKTRVRTYRKEDVMDILENETSLENIIKKTADKSLVFDINCDPALIPKINDPENKENTESLSDNKISESNLLSSEINQQNRDFFLKPLLPHCVFSQSQNYLIINIHCGSIDVRNIQIESVSSKMFHFQYKLIGKGCTPLFYGGFICTSPYPFKTNGISHNIQDNSLSIIVEKKKLSTWQKVSFGEEPKKLKEVKIENLTVSLNNNATGDDKVIIIIIVVIILITIISY